MQRERVDRKPGAATYGSFTEVLFGLLIRHIGCRRILLDGGMLDIGKSCNEYCCQSRPEQLGPVR